MEKSRFFNSSDGDRVYDATDFAAYFGSLVSNGVFYAAATNLQGVRFVYEDKFTVEFKAGVTVDVYE